MSRAVFSTLIRFILLVFLQAFLLKNLGYYNLATPFLYILIILLLPFETPNFLLFSIAFGTGLIMDGFYDTMGIHAAACSVLALVRVLFISITVQRHGFESESDTMGSMNFRWFFFYSVVLTLFHHTTLFLLESFNLFEIQYTFLRIVLSSSLTILLILVYEFIFGRKKSR